MKLTNDLRQEIRSHLTAWPAAMKKPNVERRTSAGLWAKPFHSTALGVQPHQIAEAREHLRANGVAADFDTDGRCIISSDKQYKDVAKACGIYDGRDGYRPKDYEGNPILSGRDRAKNLDELKQKMRRGQA